MRVRFLGLPFVFQERYRRYLREFAADPCKYFGEMRLALYEPMAVSSDVGDEPVAALELKAVSLRARPGYLPGSTEKSLFIHPATQKDAEMIDRHTLELEAPHNGRRY